MQKLVCVDVLRILSSIVRFSLIPFNVLKRIRNFEEISVIAYSTLHGKQLFDKICSTWKKGTELIGQPIVVRVNIFTGIHIHSWGEPAKTIFRH